MSQHTLIFCTLLVILVIAPNLSHCQIGGISSSKFNSINAFTLPKGAAEFEPNYNYFQSSKAWDDDGKLFPIYSSLDSIYIEGIMSFRMAYPLTDHLEFGSFIANDFSNWSFKYKLMEKEIVGLGIMAGLNIPFGVSTFSKSSRDPENILTYGIGMIGSFKINEISSIDVNVQMQEYFHKSPENQNSDFFYSIDYGHYVASKTYLLIASFWYQHSPGDLINVNKLSFHPAISYEFKANYAVVLGGNFDLSGKNIQKGTGLSFSWTITI